MKSQMLEKALKEVRSDEARREITVALTAIRCLAEILKERDRRDYGKIASGSKRKPGTENRKQKSGYKNIYGQYNGWVVRFCRKGETIYLGFFGRDELDKAVKVRDAFLESEK